MTKLDLYMTDFCPFAQRAWLSILEKEENPQSPKLFNYIEVNYFNPDLPLTKEFLKIHNTVPAGKYGDLELRESLPIAYWIDETFKQNPLQPANEEGKQRMKELIEKYTGDSSEYNLAKLHIGILFTDDDEVEKRKTFSEKLLRAYAELSKDLKASGGPYLLGQQFTIADIAIIPFVDRSVLLLGHYRGFTVPQTEEYAAFHAWRAAYAQRPSYKVTNADRLDRSIAVQPFGARKRDEYLIEVTAGYANNVRDEVRQQLRHAPAGKSTVDIEAAKREKEQKKQAAAASSK